MVVLGWPRTGVLGLAGLAVGGIYTIVLIPLGLIALASAFFYGMWSRASEGSAAGETDAHPTTNQPLPLHPRRESGHAPTSPEALTDARRTRQ